MKKVMQTMFGGTDGPRENVGNCYPACIASLLDIQLEEVPHFYQLHEGGSDEVRDAILDWMHERDLACLCFEWLDWIPRHFHGSLAIIGGQSPRGAWQRAVVGLVTRDGWRLIHDPHPSSDGIVGAPQTAEFLLPLRLLEVA